MYCNNFQFIGNKDNETKTKVKQNNGKKNLVSDSGSWTPVRSMMEPYVAIVKGI